jgi:GAF domain-containing protein
MSGRWIRKFAAAFWWIPQRGCLAGDASHFRWTRANRYSPGDSFGASMKQRSKSRGRAVNPPRLKPFKAKRSGAAKPNAARTSSNDRQPEVASLQRELNEALEQQAATSEVLRVISSSQGELEPVFEALLANAVRLCEAKFGLLLLYEGDWRFRVVAMSNVLPAFAELRQREPIFEVSPQTGLGRAVATRDIVHIADYAKEPIYKEARHPAAVALGELGGARTFLVVPILNDQAIVGVIAIYRQQVRPFADKQIELVKNFAAQAVIAIENARLLNELKESLQQQTATADVLRIISSSPGELEPVFRTILKNAIRICEAKFGHMVLADGNLFRLAAEADTPAELAEHLKQRGSFEPTPGSHLDRVRRTKQVSHTADDAAEAVQGLAAKYGGARSIVAVPMLKDEVLIGVILIYRQEVRPFADKQIELVKNFAAQAVIAIENARLLNELRDSLDRQTATSEVLSVISGSRGDLAPVFHAILENATRICEATFGSMLLREGDVFRRAALHNAPPQFEEFIKNAPILKRGMAPSFDHAIDTGQVSHTLDAAAEEPNAPIAKQAGARTLLDVPMLKGNEAIGVLGIYRQEVRPFTDKQIALVKNFAAQAVIAIENARLLNELHQRTDDLGEALQQQTATAEVLKVIARTQGELQPVFQTMLAKATELCGASYGALWLRVDDGFRYAALHGDLPQIWTDHLRNGTVIRVRPDVPLARLMQTLRPVLIPDMRTDPGYLNGDPLPVSGVDIGGIRTLVLVPMIKNNDLVGAIAIYCKEIRPFAEKQIELLSNFAAQAVIAIENARLLNELRESLQQQTATSQVLQVISSSPGELEPVFHSILKNATSICEAKFGALFLCEGDGLRAVAIHNAPPAFAQAMSSIFNPPPFTAIARAANTKQPVQIVDITATQGYQQSDPFVLTATDLGGFRTVLSVPMLREGELIGVISIYRQEVLQFTDKQVELISHFAKQAVIAVENARLLSELRERTDEVLKLNQQLEARVADQVGEIERMSRLRRFLPPQVADLIVASGAERQLESHRREITALFCDLRGFTGFSESSDPEDVMTLLRQYHAAIGEIIIKYSGTLERYAGDGVMVVFNDPVPVDNPALQAVRMALDMRAALGALIEKWRRLGHELGFGIGIAHGYATLGTIGFEGRFDYAAIGTVSNVASRLCDEAKPGQILISPRVLMAVEDAVAVEPAGDFALKGISRPLAAYNVVGAS